MRFMPADRCSRHAAPRAGARARPRRGCAIDGRVLHASTSAPHRAAKSWPPRACAVRAHRALGQHARACRSVAPPSAHAACTAPDPQSFQGGIAVAQQIQDIMTKQVHTVRTDASVLEVARIMRDRRIGDVLVTDDDGSLCGIITDRDIVVRAIAAGMPLDQTKVSEICTEDLVQVDATASIDEIIAIMREHAIRRVPVVHGDKPIGIVSIGDLAKARDPNSALADISSAAPNN
jgi:CBS domain-containing protein